MIFDRGSGSVPALFETATLALAGGCSNSIFTLDFGVGITLFDSESASTATLML
jgi:hypothetical protein